ncbi:MAG: DNRLRE domain-containing protein [Armatimonadota bacterium]|nr:DNRLRE domain-containing protein [Armatimonadota bacterium]
MWDEVLKAMKTCAVGFLVATGFLTCNLVGAEKQKGSSKVVALKPVADKGLTTGDFKGGLKPQDQDGKAPLVWVAQLVWWDVQQAIIKFDLSQLPKNLQVKKATLELYVADFKELTADKAPEPMKVRVASLPPYDIWDETNANFQMRNEKEQWSGGEIHKSIWKVLDTQTITQRGVWCRWDVTEAVSNHHEGKVALSGFLLQADYPMNHWGDLTNSPARVAFATKENPDTKLHPKLVVEMEALPKGKKLPKVQPPTHPSHLLRMPKPPFVIWYQCPFLDDLRHCNIDASVGSIRWAFENHSRGITSLMWVYGPNLYGEVKDWDVERFVGYYGSYAQQGYVGIAMDEWNVGDDHPYVPMIAEALRRVKAQFPKFFVAVWVTEPTPVFRSLVKEGAVDLAIIQGYTFVPNHPEWAISWDGVLRRVELMKSEGVLHKTVVCVGMVSPTPDKHGNRMTAEELARQVKDLAKRYPEMPGIAFYGVTSFGDYKVDIQKTKELVLLADKLAGEIFK